MIPTRLGSYTLDGTLGEGAHGVVYRARDGQGRLVALKVLRELHATDEELRRRFLREAQLSIAVVHPNVVQAYEAGHFPGAKPGAPAPAFLASELVSGGSVHGLLERHGRLDLGRTLRIAADLFRGLDAIHQRGLVHRDIKPANLLLAGDGTAKVADLGLCRTTSSDRERFTVEGAIVGTPAFVAPEQIERGEDIDIRADLYASGILIYQCLSGSLPFTAETVLMLLEAHLRQKPKPLDQVMQVPAGVARLVDDLLAKDPRRRPAHPAEALARVTALLADSGQRGGPEQATIVMSAEFPATLPGDGGPGAAPGVFPGTIPGIPAGMRPHDGAFPMTIPAGAFPPAGAVPPAGAFPQTIPAGAFPGTVAPDADGFFPATLQDGAFPATVAPQAFAATVPHLPPAAAPGPAFAATIPAEPLPAASAAQAVTIQGGELPTVMGGTLSGAGLTIGAAPAAGGIPPVVLQPLPGAAAPSFRLRTGDGRTLFCFAGPELVFGRDTPGTDPRRVCLRLFPAGAMAEQSRRISGRHFAVVIGPDGARVRDLGSSLGTAVDGQAVPRQGELPARDGSLIRVADVLSLRLRLVPPGGPGARLAGSGAQSLAWPAVLLSREENGPHHRYLLAAAPVAIDGQGPALAVGAGAWRLCAIEGALWWCADGLAIPAGTALPPLPGNGTPSCVSGPIHPDDYKG